MDILYKEYGEAIFQIKIWQGKASQLEQAIAERSNQPNNQAEEYVAESEDTKDKK